MQTDLTISGNAVARISEPLAAKDNPALKLRVFIHGGECSGFQFDEAQQEEYIATEQGRRDDGCAVVEIKRGDK